MARDNSGVRGSKNVKTRVVHDLRAQLGRGLGDKDVTCMPKRRSMDSKRVINLDRRLFECEQA